MKEIKLVTGRVLAIKVDKTAHEVKYHKTRVGKKDQITYTINPKTFFYSTNQRTELIPEGNWQLIDTTTEIDELGNFDKFEEILTPILMQYKAWEDYCWDVGDTTYFCAIAVLRGLINDDKNTHVVLYEPKN